MEIQKVIVTIEAPEKRFSADAELPAGMPVYRLAEELLALLREKHSGLFSLTPSLRLFFNGRKLERNETLASAGAWDGSVLTLQERR